MTRIHLSAPDIRPAERARIIEAVDSGWAAPAGPHLAAFEAELARCTGTGHVAALSSGTAALHLILHALGIGPGDTVVVPTLTFAATANAVVYTGASPLFVDSETQTWNLSPELLADELGRRRAGGRPVAAVIAVDLYGQCADYTELEPVCADAEVLLVSDAAESLGSSHRGAPAGSFGRAAALSFNGNKIVTASGGGAVASDDAELVSRVVHLSTQARNAGVHYDHDEVGFNYRLSNLLAAFGHGQLESLDDRVQRRRRTFARYAASFADVDGVDLQPEPAWSTSNRWLSVCTIDPDRAGCTTDELREHLDANDIEARPSWKPMHLQKAFAGAPTVLDGTADRLFATGLCLPSGSAMSDADLDRVVTTIDEFLASR